jgi:hypothetical protein
LCPDCGNKRASGRTYCEDHLAYYAEAARAYKKRKQRADKAATKKAAPKKAAPKKAAPKKAAPKGKRAV